MSPPLAVITGATSGIGLSLVRHLHAKGWRVVLADIDLSKIADLKKEFGSSAMFQQTDVSDWDSQVVLFKKAREWGGGRIDFLAANAGVTDTFGLYRLAEDIEPQKPQLDTITVNLIGVLYSVYLFKHWASKHHEKGGKIVITSSVAGVYASLASPIYSASKHALVGLTRSAGPIFKSQGIAINAILPSFTPTNLTPQALHDMIPEPYITPMKTILEAYDTLIDSPHLSGETLELVVDKTYFLKQPEYADTRMEFFERLLQPDIGKQ